MSLGDYSTNANNSAWGLSQGGSADQVVQRQIGAGWYGTPYYGNRSGGYKGPNQSYGGGGYQGAGASYGGGGGGYGGTGYSYGSSGGYGGSGSGSGSGTSGQNYNGSYSTSIDAGPIWNDQQVQGAVNQGAASIQQQNQQARQQAGQSMAARGYGAGSGLSQALTAGLNANTSAAQAANEQNLRWGAARDNASQTLASQSARANEGLGLSNLLQSQRQSDNSLALARSNQTLGLLSSMLSGSGGLSGMMSGY